MKWICDYCGELAHVEDTDYGSLCESCFMQAEWDGLADQFAIVNEW